VVEWVLVRGGQGKREGDEGAAVSGVGGGDGPAVLLDDVAGDGQTEAQAGELEGAAVAGDAVQGLRQVIH
jgi:hypothetical protein